MRIANQYIQIGEQTMRIANQDIRIGEQNTHIATKTFASRPWYGTTTSCFLKTTSMNRKCVQPKPFNFCCDIST